MNEHCVPCFIIKMQVPKQTFEMIISSLVDVGKSGNLEISGVVVEAIGHIGLRAPLLALDDKPGDADNHVEAAVVSPTDTEVSSKRTISMSVRKLFSDIILSKETKALQKTVIAYGHMCFGDPNEDLAHEALHALFGLCRSKVPQFLTRFFSLLFVFGTAHFILVHFFQ